MLVKEHLPTEIVQQGSHSLAMRRGTKSPLRHVNDVPPSADETDRLFVPAVQFLSVTAVTAADRAAGGQEPIKIGLQRETGHRAAVERGLGIVKEFIEIGVPADSLRRRPVLRRLLAYLESHPEIRYIIYTGTHLPYTRTPAHAASLARHLKRLGVGVLLTSPGSQSEKLHLWEGV